MRQSEIVWFDDEKYKKRAKNMSPDALWMRQCLKHRKIVSSGVTVGVSSLMILPIGIWISGRALDIARRKEKIIDNEVRRRNLPPYDKKLKDTLIPLGVSMVVGVASVTLNLFLLGGASSAVHVAVGDRTVHTVTESISQHPHAFLAGIEQGTESHLQQQFMVVSHHASQALQQPLGVSLDHAQSHVQQAGMQYYSHILHNGSNVAHAIPTLLQHTHNAQLPDGAAGAHTNPAISHMLEAAKNSVLGQHLSQALHQQGAATAVAQAAGDRLGGVAVVEGEKKLVQAWGLDKISASSKAQSQGCDDPGAQDIDPNVIEKIAIDALTGESRRIFKFFTRDGQAMTQRILCEKPAKKCRHEHRDGEAVLSCKFCEVKIKDDHEAYYHCCDCGVDICEVCVAGRGCGCEHRGDGGDDGKGHVLYRKGNLQPKLADLSEIEQLTVKVKEKKSETKSDPAHEKEADLEDDCSIVLEKIN